jgi:RNA polymerase sigma factor (sigma-70 family)
VEGAALDAHRYLEALSEPQRTALVLRHVMECSIEEIAEETNVSVNTVKDRLVRALARIRESIS